MKPFLLIILSVFGTVFAPIVQSASLGITAAPSVPAEKPGQAAVISETWHSSVTGKSVSGPFLNWFRAHCDLDYLGQPVSDLQWDSSGVLTQNFDRGVLELRDGDVKRREIVDQYLPDNDPALPPEMADSENYQYFSTESGGFGHAVRNQLQVGGQTINLGFKAFFDRCGGRDSFGYPKEEPTVRNGRWTQRFQAAIFQYFYENDNNAVNAAGMPMRNWKVQAALRSDIQGLASQPQADAIPVPPGMMALTLYFANPDGSQLQAQRRLAPYTTGVIRASLNETLKGPQVDGLHAIIFPGTQLLSLDYAGGIAQPNLSAHFLMSENHALATRSILLALTQIAGVRGVLFKVDGKRLDTYWGPDYGKALTR